MLTAKEMHQLIVREILNDNEEARTIQMGPDGRLLASTGTILRVCKGIAQAHEEEVAILQKQLDICIDNSTEHEMQELYAKEQLAIMPCGHHASNAISSRDEDIDPKGESDRGKTAHCGMCELEGQNEKLRDKVELWHSLQVAQHDEATQLQAQVAVMAAALREYRNNHGYCQCHSCVRADIALEFSPKVLHRLLAKRAANISGDTLLAFPWEEGGVRVVQAYDPAMERYGDEWVEVMVLECSVNQASGPKSEQ